MTEYHEIDVDEVKIISSEQIQEGTTNDNPDHVFEVELPDGERGWVAGPHGVSTCAIREWLRFIDGLAETREEAIAQGCE